MLALTATADLESWRRLTEKLNMKNVTEVIVSESRPNIRIGLCQVPRKDHYRCLDWVVKELPDEGPAMSPIIIYCRSFKAIGRVYGYLRKQLGEKAWVDQDPLPEKLMIEIYHSHTLEQNKKHVISSFNGDGFCRVVCCSNSLEWA